MALKSYRDLEVWQKAMDLVVEIYRLVGKFPRQEQYGLTLQMQRAAVSIPSNIAEGYGRLHRGDYIHHVSIARGSLAELETQLTLSVRLGFASRNDVLPIWSLTQDVGQMLTRLLSSLESKATKDPRDPRPETRNPTPKPPKTRP
jgi:four helix bundle protein